MTRRGARRDATAKTRRFNQLKSQTRENDETAGGDTERRKTAERRGGIYRKRGMFSRL